MAVLNANELSSNESDKELVLRVRGVSEVAGERSLFIDNRDYLFKENGLFLEE